MIFFNLIKYKHTKERIEIIICPINKIIYFDSNTKERIEIIICVPCVVKTGRGSLIWPTNILSVIKPEIIVTTPRPIPNFKLISPYWT